MAFEQAPNALSLIQLPQVDSPTDNLLKAYQLKGMQQSQALNSVKVRQAQQELQDTQDVRQAAMESNGDPDKILQVLQTRNPNAAAKYNEELTTQRKTAADARKQQLENDSKSIDTFGQLFNGVKDQDGYSRALRQAAVTPSLAQFAQQAPQQYDKATVDQFQSNAMDHKSFVEAQQKADQLLIDQQKAKASESEATTKSSEAEQKRRTDQMKAVNEFLAGTSSQAQVDQGKQTYKAIYGIDPAAFDAYGPWSPDVPRRAKEALTATLRPTDLQLEVQEHNQNPVALAKFGPVFAGLQAEKLARQSSSEINTAVAKENAIGPIQTQNAINKETALAPIQAANAAQKTQAEQAVKNAEAPQKVKDQISDSMQALDQVSKVRQLIRAHPEIIGPVIGRLAKGSVQAGTSFGFASPEQEDAASQLNTNLGNLLLNEARVASPGRSNGQVLAILKGQSADMGKNANIVEGALKGVEDRANIAINNGKRYGINIPGSPAGNAASGPKVGDVVSVKGKKVKITAIHADGTFDGTPQ